MNDDRLRTAPTERFDAEHLVFDLHAEASSLETEHGPNKHGHRQKTLYKHAGRTVALFVLDAGSCLREHAANGVVTVQAIEGTLHVTAGSEAHNIKAGGILVMAPGVRHDVRADSRAVFLLQISLPAPSGQP